MRPSIVRILIVDDHEHIRRSVRVLLASNSEWLICGEAADGQQAISQCLLLKPHLIILDIHMPVLNGFEAAKQIQQSHPEILILMLTTDVGAHFAFAAAACGARGFLSKAGATDQLVTAISTLLRGDRYFLNAEVH